MSTERLRFPVLRRPWPSLSDGLGVLIPGVAVAALAGAILPLHPELWRGALAAALTINLIVLGVKWPGAAAVLTLLYLPFLGFLRRIMIGEAGWTANDPLLLVGPIVAVFLVYRLFLIERRRLAPDRLSKLVVLLLIIAFIGVLNPVGAGGLAGGVGGLLFLGVPLLWFLIGRELPSRRTMSVLMPAVVGVALVVAAYGLYQTEFGSLPRWDRDWFHIAGYGALVADRSEGGALLFRPWSTFASGAEYTIYLGIGWSIAVAMVLHRRYLYAFTLPVFGAALISSGGRSLLALSFFTAVVLLGLRSRNGIAAIAIVTVGIGATYGAALALGDRLDRIANLSGNTGAERQTSGLLNPLDPGQSTFLSHWDNFLNAVKAGFTNPVGSGTGQTNPGGRLGGSGGYETDIDIGDAFVSWGFVGGIVFVLIIVLAFRAVFSKYLRGPPDVFVLAVAGVMVVSFEQWLQGGHYAASPLLWFLLGWAARPSARQLEKEAEFAHEGLSRLQRLGKRPQHSPA